MTDVLERAAETVTVDEGASPAAAATAGRPCVPYELRLVLGALSVGAGVIHLAMVPSHMGEWAAEGIAFLLVGWAQLVWGGLVVSTARPSRALYGLAALANLGFVAAWLVTRTTGSPWGPHAAHPESASLIDMTTVALEAALVLGIILALGRSPRPAASASATPGSASASDAVSAPASGPVSASSSGGAGARWAGVGAAAALLLSVGVLASPSARNHAHDAHGGHGAAAHDHSVGGAAATAHGTGDDRGLSLLHNGQHHHIAPKPLDAATQARLDAQLAITRQVAAANPTVAAAEAHGYRRIGPYFPGIGAHYGKTTPAELNASGRMDREALLHPLAIIYDGTAPTSRVAGFMYLSTAKTVPAGFAGDNDVWHFHEHLCIDYKPNGEIDVPFGLDNESTPAQCAQVHGRMLPISPWMVHVWSAPGWDDDPDVPTFAEVHTDLTCPDGTYYMLPVSQWATHPLNVCRSNPK